MGDIDVLNPLQIVVPACGQVQACDSGAGRDATSSPSYYWTSSVGRVLLVVRYGKSRTRTLDDLSYPPSARQPIDTEVGLT